MTDFVNGSIAYSYQSRFYVIFLPRVTSQHDLITGQNGHVAYSFSGYYRRQYTIYKIIADVQVKIVIYIEAEKSLRTNTRY